MQSKFPLRLKGLLSILAAAIFLAGCFGEGDGKDSIPGTPQEPVDGGGGGDEFVLVFADEFDQGTLSAANWTIETGYGPDNNGWGNNEWQLYTDSSDNVRVEDGNLVLSAQCSTPPCGVRDGTITSGKINSLNKFNFKFGKIEARIKPPVGEAAWPAFWALGANHPVVGWPRSGEIDFMEMHNAFSNDRTAHFTMHWCDETLQAPEECSFPDGWIFFTQNTTFDSSLGDDFHIFEAEWDAERIVGKIDGVSFFTRTIDPGTMEEFLEEFYMILNVAMGGTLGSDNRPPSGNEIWPQTMLVDYVRVYQREPGPGGGGDDGLFIDFESGPYTFNDFEGGVSAVIDNPQPNGINTSAKVAQLQKFGGAVFAGSTLVQPVDLPPDSSFNMKVFSSRPVPVLFKLEDGGVGVERTVMHSGSGWENLTFDFSSAAGSFTGISIIFELGTPGDADNNPDDWTFYVDDIELVGGDPGGGGGGATSFDFEPAGGPYIFNDFEGGVALVIANPQSGGINTSANVAEMRKFAGAVFAGSTLEAQIDVPMGSSFTMKVWSQRSVDVLFKLEGVGDADVEVELPHAGGGWEEMTFAFPDYANTIEGITVIFDLGDVGDAEANPVDWTFYIDDIALLVPEPGSDLEQVDLPISFDDPDVNYAVVDFGEPVSAMTTIVADPDDAGNRVASTVKPVGAPLWAGTTMSTTDGLASAVPFTSTMSTIGVRVYSPDAGIPVRLKAETLDASVGVEVEVLTTVANEWETLVFDFANQVPGTPALDLAADYRLLSVFFNFGTDGDTAGAKTYLWDDVEFGTMAPVVDEMPPMLTSVAIASNNVNSMALARAGDTVTLTLVADEAITMPVVMIAGAPADAVTGAGVNWQASKTFSGAEANGIVTFDVAYADLAGNSGMNATMTTNGSGVTLDTIAPTVMINDAPATFTSLDPITLTFQFSEAVTGFALADIVVTNGTKSALATIDTATYTASVRPSGTSDLLVNVVAGGAVDAAGNLSEMAAQVTVTSDLTEVPLSTVSIASDNANTAYARTGDVVTVDMTAPDDIVEPMVTIAGEPADVVTGDGTAWQASRTMLDTDAEGEIEFEIDYEYADGNPGLLTSGTTDDSMVTFDISAPELTITGVPATVNAMDTVTATFSFDEDVVDFDLGDIMVTNGSADAFDPLGGSQFTAEITADGNGDVTVTVDDDVATDLAGNGIVGASETATLNLTPAYEMFFSDDFSSGSLNPANWTARTDVDCPPPCEGAQTYFAERVIVAGGVLSIEARNVARGGSNFTSGLVDTLGKHQLKYGKIEIDARMPGTQGTLPSLWLLPVSDEYGPWPQSGQIDIVNAPEIGVAGNVLEHATRYGLPVPEDTVTTFDYLPPFAPDAAVHTYAVEWNATEIRWYVDGVNVVSQTEPNWYAYFQDADDIYTEGAAGAPFDQEFYLLIGLAMDTNAGSGTYPQTLAIDEVRVFECANPDDAALGTGCITGTAMNVLTAEPGPYIETLAVYTDAPAMLDFFDPQNPATPVSSALVPGSAASNGSVVVNSNPAAADGANTVWNLDISALAGTGSAFMRARDEGALSGYFNLSGGATAGELLFRMRVRSATAAEVHVSLTGDTGSGSVAVPIAADGVWRDYSVKIGDIVTDSVMNAMSIDLATVTDLFSIAVTNGSANLDLDDISVKVACRDTNGCSAQARLPTVTELYSQNFDGLDIMGPEIGDNWDFFVNVFSGPTYRFGYGGNAPNGTGQISGLVDDQGGAPQGTQQLSVFSDYNCCPGGEGHNDPDGLVETNVFQEPRPTSSPITAADVGQTWTFSFDAKRGNIGEVGDAQALAFFKVLNPNSGFSQTAFVTEDMTAISPDWTRYTIELTIGDWIGQILQYGYVTNASNFDPSGNFYDNVELNVVSKE